MLLDKAAAVLTNAARGVEEAALLLPRADGAAVFDEACIASIEKGCVCGKRRRASSLVEVSRKALEKKINRGVGIMARFES